MTISWHRMPLVDINWSNIRLLSGCLEETVKNNGPWSVREWCLRAPESWLERFMCQCDSLEWIGRLKGVYGALRVA